MNRSESQPAPSSGAMSNGQQQQFHDDSSEDEIPVPMKLSALTKALLNDGAPESVEQQPSPPRTRRRVSALNASTSSASESRRHLRSGSVQFEGRSSKPSSPVGSRDPSPVRRRVVRLSTTPQSLSQMRPAKRRSTSNSRSTQRAQPSSRPASRDMSSDERNEPQPDVNTPVPAGRVVRIASGSSSNRSRMGSSGPSSGRSNFDRSVMDKSAVEQEHEQIEEPPTTVARNPPPFSHGSVSRYPSTSTRTRPDENLNLQSSMRIKRVGKVAGSFLSGPARRGRRRQSEEEAEANGEMDHLASSQEPDSQAADDGLGAPYYGDGVHEFNSGSPVSASVAARAVHRRHPSNLDLRNGSARPSPREHSPREPEPAPEPKSAPRQESEPEQQQEEEIHYRIPPHLEMPSRRDQENNLLLSHKRPKSAAEQVLEKASRRPIVTELQVQRGVSPERKPLASMARNTPLRPAPPPPPKMSVLDAATSTAGAATTTQVKQRRNILRVNGKCYTRLDCLGRGGSAKVYRVTAENGKMLALKRVMLDNADESTIRGYRGEIDLLGKLSGVDRVINLFDYEMNSEKQVLTLVCLTVVFATDFLLTTYRSWRWASWT